MTGELATRRAVLSAALATGVTVGLAGCGGGSGRRGPKTVEMTDDLTFEPETVAVPVGATVVWKNVGDVGHTVTAYEDGIPADAAYFASGGFETERAARNDIKGGLVAGDETYRHTFEVPGRYEYYCIPHEGSGMVGTVRVKK